MTSHRAAAAASAAAAAAAAVDGRRVGDKCASGVRDEPLTHTLSSCTTVMIYCSLSTT